MADENNSQVVEVSQETAENKEAMAEGETVEEIRTDTPTLPVALQIQKEVSSPLLADPMNSASAPSQLYTHCSRTGMYR
jgi:hypothetical protein